MKSNLLRPWIADIGCGADPIPFANILVDNNVGDTDQRTGELRTDGKIFYRADIMDLPFDDGELDFIYCNHVLEHLDRPDKALDELQRVSAKGMIGLPAMRSEAVALYYQPKKPPVHKWLSWRNDSELNMLSYNCADRQSAIRALMTLGEWPPNARGQWEEIRMGWGWGSWPAQLTVRLWQLRSWQYSDGGGREVQ